MTNVSTDWRERLRECAGSHGFRLVKPLGEGGFGETWLAENRKGEKVAFKFASPGNPNALAALRREAELYHGLREGMTGAFKTERPPIARIKLSLLDADPPALVMEYMAGGDLRKFMERRFNEPLTLAESLPIIKKALAALAFAHRMKIIHRDLSPENILRGEEEGDWKVSDFGLGSDRLASAVSFERSEQYSQAVSPEAMAGKLHYMAPEQRRIGERVGPPADIYSLGVIWAQLLTGDLKSGLPALWQDEAPDEALPFLRRCLAKDPAQRPSAADLLKELQEMNGSESASAGAATADPPKKTKKKRKIKKRWTDDIPAKFRRNIYVGTYEEYEQRNESLFRFYRGFMLCVWACVIGLVGLKFGPWAAGAVFILFLFSFFHIGF